jgi:hypothetical protein
MRLLHPLPKKTAPQTNRAEALLLKNSETKRFRALKANCVLFFHPDYTVGPGVSHGSAVWLADFTAGRESHPALKIYSFVR